MKVYQVFRHPDKGLQAVKRGFSWPGFFLSWAWALSRQLWLEAALLLLFSAAWAAIGFGVAAGEHSVAIVLALLSMLFAGIKGNAWRSRNLEARGFLLLGAITARDAQDACAKVAAAGDTVPAELKARSREAGLLAMPAQLQALFAIVALTWKAAFRYRLFWVIVALLLGAVIGLPLLVKHDGTAEGFAQILVTYTLGAVTALLGLCTLWLACGTLARDVEECQIQMVAVKPIARWQIWLGKWLGLVLLNAALLAIVGISVYSLLELRARKLAPEELAKLQSEVLVARGSARETGIEKYIAEETAKRVEAQKAKGGFGGLDEKAFTARVEEQVRAEKQSVGPNQYRLWIIHLGVPKARLKGEPIYLRIRFNVPDGPTLKLYAASWRVGDPAGKQPPWQNSAPMSFTSDSFHEFAMPSEALDDDGNIAILFLNANDSTLLFPLDEGMEVLYREGGFALNLVRGLGIILCWMALFAALGLAAASFLSFPVAAFCSLAILSLGLSSGTLNNVVTEGTILGADEETGQLRSSALDAVMIPFFDGMLKVINLAQQFSPVDSLSTGRSVSWSQLGRAAAQIVLLMGGLLAVFGMFVFHRRELATAQGTH